jgi:hypothetical protein
MKSKFVPPLDKTRVMAENFGVINRWFELLDSTIESKSIKLSDIYNMDEKGCMMGWISDNRVLLTKDERVRKKSYVT